MTKNTNIVIGGYYETNENKIAYLYGFSETNILYKLNNDNKGYSIDKKDFSSWKYREDLRDYPDAVDPKLPYVFDLNYDIKYTSDLLRELKNNGQDQKDLIELIKETKIYENNKEIKKALEKFEENLFNHIKVKEVVYELPTKNALYKIKNNDKNYTIFRNHDGLYQELLTEKGFVFEFSSDKNNAKIFKSLEDCAKAITKEEKKLMKQNNKKLKP